MKDLLSSIELPAYISQNNSEVYSLLKSFELIMGTHHAKKWVALALYHKSAVSTLNIPISMKKDIKTYLLFFDLIGDKFIELCLYHIAYSSLSIINLNDAHQYVQVIKDRIYDEIIRILNLHDHIVVSDDNLLKDDKIKQGILTIQARQLMGVVSIYCRYETIYKFIENISEDIFSKIPATTDYKTVLQEFTQSRNIGIPKYTLIDEYGPDHDRRFKVNVMVSNGNKSEGDGNSKKKAEQKSALNYLEKYAPHLLKNKISNKRTKPFHEIPVRHKEILPSLAEAMNIPSSGLNLLSQALTHKSFLHESKNSNIADYSSISQLGSKIYNMVISIKICESMVVNRPVINNPYKYLGEVTIVSKTAEAFYLLNLQKYMLVGKVQKNNITDNIKADTFYAILSALFISRKIDYAHDIDKLFNDQLLNWINKNISILINNEKDFSDYKTMLQELLQAIEGFEWFYETYKVGPDHQAEYISHVIIKSKYLNRKLKIGAGKGFKKTEAEKHVSKIAFNIIRNANFNLQPFNNNTGPAYFLQHQLQALLNNKISINRWKDLGLLGSNLLINGRYSDFIVWSENFELLISNYFKGNAEIYRKKINNFYSDISPDIAVEELFSRISEIRVYLRDNLDPEKPDTMDIMKTKVFHDILSLSQILKLSTKEIVNPPIAEVLSDFVFLRKDRNLNIIIDNIDADMRSCYREGIILTLLNSFTERIIELGATGTLKINVSKNNTGVIEIQFINPVIGLVDDELRDLINDILWSYMKRDIPITDILFNNECITMLFKHMPCDSFATNAINSFKQGSISKRKEISVLSKFLHDIKNHLITYQLIIEASMNASDKTQKLKNQFEASQQIDQIELLISNLEISRLSMVVPTVEPINLNYFFRQYRSTNNEKIPLNINIHIECNDDKAVFTSSQFLYSITDNIINNSIEAMVSGGNIWIDWIYDQVEKVALIEFSDDGPGISDELLSKINSGELIESDKKQGTGMGIFTIRSTLRRLGGTYQINRGSESKGLKWSIWIPSIDNKETSIVNNDS